MPGATSCCAGSPCRPLGDNAVLNTVTHVWLVSTEATALFARVQHEAIAVATLAHDCPDMALVELVNAVDATHIHRFIAARLDIINWRTQKRAAMCASRNDSLTLAHSIASPITRRPRLPRLHIAAICHRRRGCVQVTVCHRRRGCVQVIVFRNGRVAWLNSTVCVGDELARLTAV